MVETEKEIKGTISISFDTDGDFGFSNLDEIREHGWVINHDDYDYTFNLDYTGKARGLSWKIIEDLFENIHTHRIYLMRRLCDAFEELTDNCDTEKMERNVYVDMGNQTIEAEFIFEYAAELDSLKLQVERLKECIEYEKEQIKDRESKLSEYEEMKIKAEKQIVELENKKIK